jgi:2'-5' RNA ligase
MEPNSRIGAMRPLGWHNYYFAFRLDEPASDAAIEIQSDMRRRYGAAGTAIKRSNLHVSLFPLWDGKGVPPDLIEITVPRVEAIEGRPFEFTFDMLMSFKSKKGHCTVLAATHAPAELYNLHRKFASRFEGLVKAGSLTPHITLLYTDQFIEKQPVKPVRWMVREFLLIDSFVGQGRQEVLGRWPLR